MVRSEEVGSYAVLCGKVVTKHVKKIIVTSRPVVMTQPTRIGQIIRGEGESERCKLFQICLPWLFFLTGRNSCALFSKQRALFRSLYLSNFVRCC